MTGAQYLMTGAKCEYFWCPVYNTYLTLHCIPQMEMTLCNKKNSIVRKVFKTVAKHRKEF